MDFSDVCDQLSEADALRADNRQLREALRSTADQIAHLQEISGTDKHGPLDALRDARALLAKLGEGA